MTSQRTRQQFHKALRLSYATHHAIEQTLKATDLGKTARQRIQAAEWSAYETMNHLSMINPNTN